jgi:Ser/Thr protein kinase RdoA (MazF antagonist)
MSAFLHAPPTLSPAELEGLARDRFGVSGQARALQSERDQNARIRAPGGTYVLKIANQGEDPAQIALQNATLAHLERAGVAGLPRLVRTTDGADCADVQQNGQTSLVRLVTWIDGRPMSETPRTLAQLAALGAFMGRLSKGMQGFGHAAAFRPDFPWSLDHVMTLRPWAADIADPARRALIEGLFARYADRIAPAFRRCGPRSCIRMRMTITSSSTPTRLTGSPG